MTVVVGVDFSKASRKAYTWAQEYAQQRGEPLLLVHSFSGPRHMPGSKTRLDPIGEVEAELEAGDVDQLTQWAEEARGAGLDASTVAVSGRPGEVILDAAEEHKASAIVVGASGAGAIAKAMLGNTALAVVKHAKCPVMVIPA